MGQRDWMDSIHDYLKVWGPLVFGSLLLVLVLMFAAFGLQATYH